MPYRVRVDLNKCIACGLAWTICDKVFEPDPETGKTIIKSDYKVEETSEYSIGLIPDELYECVKKAEENCPVQAISIEEK